MAEYPKPNGHGKTNGDDGSRERPVEKKLSEMPSLLEIKEEIPPLTAPSDGNNLKFDRNPYQINSPEWNIGWTDGRYGQPRMTHLDIIEAEASFQAEDELIKIQQEIAENKAKSVLLNHKIEYLMPRLEEQQRQFNLIQSKRILDRQEYSNALANVYLLFAIGLFIADVPLTIKLVAEGFGLSPSGDNKITPDTFFYITNLIQLIIDYSGVFLLAIGLMMSGLFVKIFLDKVIFCEPGERSNSKLTFGLTTGFLLIALGLYVYTFIYLGYYRENQLEVSERKTAIKEVENNFGNMGIVLGAAKTDVEKKQFEDEKNNAVEKRVKELKEQRSTYAVPVFIALTILFPVVGGLCFSIGARKRYKVKLYKELKEEGESTEKEVEMTVTENEKIKNLLIEKEEELKQKKNSTIKRENLAKLRKNVYRHGYERGSKMMQTLNEGESLYERCESLVLTKLAEKSRYSIWHQTEKEEKKND